MKILLNTVFFVAATLMTIITTCAENKDQPLPSSNNSVVSITLPAETATLKPSDLSGYVIASQRCVICHSVDYIKYQPPRMNQIQWTAEVTKMQKKFGAPLTDDEVAAVGAYLSVAYGGVNAADETVVAASNRVKN